MSYPPEVGASPTGDSGSKREAVLHVMAAASFLVFFQAYLVAPLIPSLSVEFHASTDFLGMLVPAYMLPYGISTLFYGPISDRFGRKAVILTLLGLMVVTLAGVATANTVVQMMVWRLLGGAITGGTVPIALALLGDIFPYEERGRPLGWIFGAAAGGMAFGSTLGAFLNPIIGWRKEFLITAALTAAVLALRGSPAPLSRGGNRRPSIKPRQGDCGILVSLPAREEQEPILHSAQQHVPFRSLLLAWSVFLSTLSSRR